MTYATDSQCGCGPDFDYGPGDAQQAEEVRSATDPECIWEAMAKVFEDGWEESHDQMAQAAADKDDAELGRKFRELYTQKLPGLAERHLQEGF